jgi:Fungal chitosanase of glycosyl hydrolase group 75
MKTLLTIQPVTIYQALVGRYVKFISDLDICNDGSGPAHGDPSYQAQTAYYNSGKYLNADVDKYIVIPPQIRYMVAPVVMGCQARLTNLKTGVWHAAMTGDIGPDQKTGEAAYCLAKIINPDVTHNAGDQELIYLYELWPGLPAKVGDTTYKLEPA